MLHIIDKYLGKDKQGNHHYVCKCTTGVATSEKLAPPQKDEPLVVVAGDDGNVLCKVCDAAQYNIEHKMGNYLNGAAQQGFIRSKPDGDAVGKEEPVVVEGYGIDGELSSDEGLGGYEQTL